MPHGSTVVLHSPAQQLTRSVRIFISSVVSLTGACSMHRAAACGTRRLALLHAGLHTGHILQRNMRSLAQHQ
jgi:hypothetical protein